jgi:hypothetical protein
MLKARSRCRREVKKPNLKKQEQECKSLKWGKTAIETKKYLPSSQTLDCSTPPSLKPSPLKTSLSLLLLLLLLETSDSQLGVAFAEGLAGLDEEALAFEVLLAKSAVEALAVVVVVEGLDPAISGFDREPARNALRREQLVPVLFAVGQPVFKVERRVGEDLAAVGAHETLRVEGLAHRLQAVL